jgi:hypothetical protein
MKIKIKLKHNWVPLTMHSLTDDQAKASLEGVEIPRETNMIVSVTGPICGACGAPYAEAPESCTTPAQNEEMGTSRPVA